MANDLFLIMLIMTGTYALARCINWASRKLRDRPPYENVDFEDLFGPEIGPDCSTLLK